MSTEQWCPTSTFLLFLENICLQQENITGHIDHPNANQSHGRQTQRGKARWYPEYTCTDKDNAGLGMISKGQTCGQQRTLATNSYHKQVECFRSGPSFLMILPPISCYILNCLILFEFKHREFTFNELRGVVKKIFWPVKVQTCLVAQ